MSIRYENTETVVASGSLEYRLYEKDGRLRLDFYKGDHLYYAIDFSVNDFRVFAQRMIDALLQL